MKRAGFTMIELIFVIVILGILAAVALPKFIGVASQAQAGKLSAYVGTLNRTVAPALWSLSMANQDAGSLAAGGAVDYNAQLLQQIITPTNLEDAGTAALPNPAVASCSAYAIANPGPAYTAAELMAWAMVASVTIGGDLFEIRCMDGSGTEAPHFVLTKTPAGGAMQLVVQ